MRRGVGRVVVLHELEELARAVLLEEAQQWGGQRLHVGGRNLEHLQEGQRGGGERRGGKRVSRAGGGSATSAECEKLRPPCS